MEIIAIVFLFFYTLAKPLDDRDCCTKIKKKEIRYHGSVVLSYCSVIRIILRYLRVNTACGCALFCMLFTHVRTYGCVTLLLPFLFRVGMYHHARSAPRKYMHERGYTIKRYFLGISILYVYTGCLNTIWQLRFDPERDAWIWIIFVCHLKQLYNYIFMKKSLFFSLFFLVFFM